MKLENVADIYPLAPVQQGMLFHTLNAPESGVYVGQYTCQLRGNLQTKAFHGAWQQVLARHSVLRTAFLWEGLDEPLQVVRQQADLPWLEQDWQDLSATEQETRLTEFLNGDRTQSFDLAEAPLMRLHLIRLSEQRYQFIWSFHHLLSDGWSTPIIWQEVLTSYTTACAGQTLTLPSPRPYRDYIAWLQQQDLADAQTFWQDTLQGVTDPTTLPIAQTPSAATPSSYDQQQIDLTVETTATLQGFARQHRLTLNTLIHGAWTLLLSRYSGETEVIYGATVAGRPTTLIGVETMVGPFINTLPVRGRLSAQATLLPWLTQLQSQLLEIRQYEYTPLVEIQRWSDVPAGQSLFESILVFENYPLTAQDPELGLEIRNVRFLEQSHYPLALLVIPGESLQLLIVYDTSHFQAEAIARLLGHLQQLFEEFVANPHRALGEISLLTDTERHQLLEAWNQTQIPYPQYPQDACIHHLFEEQVQQTPEAVAVVFEHQSLTYQELNHQANQLAQYLASQSVGPNVLVGICMERSLDIVVAIWGVLKAGGAYVPLDPTYPSDRLAYMLQETEAAILLTQQRLRETLPTTTIPTLCLDKDNNLLSTPEPSANRQNPQPNDLAYILFTSGSTGKPKGVKVSHRNLVHSTTARFHYYRDPVSRFLLLSSFAFDSSVAGIFWTFCQGGTLMLPPQRIEQDMEQLAAFIAHHRITHTLCLPSLYSLLLTYAPPEKLRSLHTVIVAGEACGRSLATQHETKLPQTLLYNEYGPTEATVWSSVYPITNPIETAQVPMGRPIANTQIYLLDANLQPVPIGIPGEIYIGGAGVSQGYLNQPERTTQSFISHPFDSDAQQRLYRTGDLARYRPDGNIEFLGRSDRQVKIRGYRIELSEIEEILKQHPDISEVVLTVSE